MGIGRFVEYKETRHDEGSIRPPIIVAYRPLSFPVKCGWITPRWWSGLILSLAWFLSFLSCRKYSVFHPKKVSHSYVLGVYFVGMRHPNEPNTALNLKFWWQPVLLSIRQACNPPWSWRPDTDRFGQRSHTRLKWYHCYNQDNPTSSSLPHWNGSRWAIFWM